MFEPLDAEARASAGEEGSADGALREGLRGLSVPAISAGFDDRVLAALRPDGRLRQWPWGWQPLWNTLRPVLGGAGCSLVLTAALYTWTIRLPVDSRPAQSGSTPEHVALDRALLERAALDPSTVGYFSLFRRGWGPATSPTRAPAADRRRREDRSSRPASLPARQS